MKYVVTLNGKNYEVEVEETEAVITAVTDAAPTAPAVPAAAPAPAQTAPAAAPAQTVGAGVQVTSPMPGNILDVRISVGQAVKQCGFARFFMQTITKMRFLKYTIRFLHLLFV